MIAGHKQKQSEVIYSGVPWFDDKGNVVSAHGANIVNKKTYLAVCFLLFTIRIEMGFVKMCVIGNTVRIFL